MILIRHAESEWNVPFGRVRIDSGIPDPALTRHGLAQADDLATELTACNLIRLLVSPYRRTLKTASIISQRLSLDMTVEPLVRERCAFSCDQGSSPSDLAEEWPGIDFSALDDYWWGRRIESIATLSQRGATFMDKAAAMPDRARVGVVTHWGFIRCLTDRSVGNAECVQLPETNSPSEELGAKYDR